MKELKVKLQRKHRRQVRVRKKLMSSKSHLRLCVFRSNVHIYAQIIDDTKGATVVSITEKELDKNEKMTKIDRARILGAKLAEKAKVQKIDKVAFDKGPYKYHGRVKSFAEGAREGGLQF